MTGYLVRRLLATIPVMMVVAVYWMRKIIRIDL